MTTPLVHTVYGDIEGFTHDGIQKFFGVPYCKAPIGNRRFRRPEPLEPWEGVLKATQHSPMCPQGPSDLELAMGPLHRPIGEDSLTLTISTPDTKGKHPVAVWFHGGANISGAGNIDWYDGECLARHGNIVVVGVNFRIGALGFLYHPALNTDNLSILDQIEALRWIQKNIEAFGGDPTKVTIFGQSAGGNAIAHMIALPETEGLFQNAILQSPSIGRGNHTQADAIRIAECHFKHLGLDPKDPQFREKINAKSMEEILRATDAVFAEMGREFAGMLFKPVKDEWASPEATAEAAAKEAIRRNLNVVLGTTADEMHAFVQPKNAEEEKAIREGQYLRYDHPDDLFMRLTSAGNRNTWKYRFIWKAPKSKFDSCHTLELPFVFGTLEAWAEAPMLAGAGHEEMQRLSESMQDAWCQFFNRGSFEETYWPRFNEKTAIHKIFDNHDNPCQSVVFTRPE